MLLTKDFVFDAAHNLVNYHGKCEKLHGHTYKLRIVIEGFPDNEGMIIDFVEVSKIIKEKIIAKLDHSYLNDFIPQPSAENISLWVWENIENDLKRENCKLYEIHVWETSTSRVILNADDVRKLRNV